MTQLLEGPRKEARSKGTKALLAWVGTGAGTALATIGLHPVLGLIVGGFGATLSLVLTWAWLKYRGEWGLRF